jgi:hypothetical protein
VRTNYVTLLRQPLQQIISAFFHLNNERASKGQRLFKLKFFAMQFHDMHVKVGDVDFGYLQYFQ